MYGSLYFYVFLMSWPILAWDELKFLLGNVEIKLYWIELSVKITCPQYTPIFYKLNIHKKYNNQKNIYNFDNHPTAILNLVIASLVSICHSILACMFLYSYFTIHMLVIYKYIDGSRAVGRVSLSYSTKLSKWVRHIDNV